MASGRKAKQTGKRLPHVKENVPFRQLPLCLQRCRLDAARAAPSSENRAARSPSLHDPRSPARLLTEGDQGPCLPGKE